MLKQKKKEPEVEEEVEAGQDLEVNEEYVDESPDTEDYETVGKDASIIHMQLNTADLLEGIKKDLKGGYTDEKGDFVITGKALMDNVHIDQIMTFMRTELSEHVLLSNLNDAEIEVFSEQIALDLLPIFYTAKMPTELKLPKVKQIRRIVHIQLKRAKMALQLKLLNEEIHVQYTGEMGKGQDMPRKKSLFGRR